MRRWRRPERAVEVGSLGLSDVLLVERQVPGLVGGHVPGLVERSIGGLLRGIDRVVSGRRSTGIHGGVRTTGDNRIASVVSFTISSAAVAGGSGRAGDTGRGSGGRPGSPGRSSPA